jgi:hypothetical protein
VLLSIFATPAATSWWFWSALLDGLRTLPRAAVWLGLLVAPGAWLPVLVARRRRLDLPEMGAISFAATLAIAGVAGTIAFFARLPLEAVTAGLALGMLASAAAVAAVVSRRWRVDVGAGGAGLAIAGIAGLLSAGSGFWLAHQADSFYHLAAIRTLVMTDRPVVTDPFLATASRAVDPTTGSWHTLLAAFTRLLGSDPVIQYNAMGVAITVLLALTVWSVMRGVSKGTWAPAIATAVALFAVYHLDFRIAFYPNTFSVPVALLALVLMLRAFQDRDAAIALAAALAGIGAASVHMGTAELYFLGLALVFAWCCVAALAARKDPHATATAAGLLRVAGIGTVVVLASAPLLLARFAAMAGWSASVSGIIGNSIDMPTVTIPGTLMRMVAPDAVYGGPAWLYLPWIAMAVAAGWVAFVKREQVSFRVAAIASMPVLTVGNPIVSAAMLSYSPYMAFRIQAAMMLCMYAAIAWALSIGWGRDWRLVVRGVAIAVSIALVVMAAGPVNHLYTGRDYNTVWKSRSADVRKIWGGNLEPALTATVGKSRPMVVGSASTVYMIAGLSWVRVPVVAPAHMPIWYSRTRTIDTTRDMVRLLDPWASRQDRDAILQRYHAVFVAFDLTNDKEAAAYRAFLADGYRVALRSGKLVLLRA